MADSGYWQPLTEDYFRIKAYELLGVASKKHASMRFGITCNLALLTLRNTANISAWATLFGTPERLILRIEIAAEDCVYATRYTPNLEPEISEFVLDIAKRDDEIYATIMQTIAPIFLAYKPAGVIWWKGQGRNGKTTLAQVIYDLFPGFIANLTIKQIEDERDAPVLNGNLANVVKESSDGYIEDSKAYKSIGTHEDFPVHKFHSQQSVMIDGSLHHIIQC